MVKPTPFKGFSHDVIFIDAIPGSGKSLLGPIISSFQNVERQTMGLFTIEHLLAASYLDICDSRLAHQLIQQIVAFNHYNMFIGRNVNMKLNDISGPLMNPHRLKYLFRLFTGSSGTDNDINLLNNDNIAPLVKIHGCIYNLSTIREAFSMRLKFIELVRHPLDTIIPWISAQDYYRNGLRGFSLRLDSNHIVYDYLRHPDHPDTCPLRQYNFLFKCIRNNFQANFHDFLLLPFEYFLFNSKICIDKLSDFLDRQPVSKQLRRALIQQKCDRYHSITSNRGFKQFQLYSTEPHELSISRDKILSQLSQNYLSSDVYKLIEHVNWYNNFIEDFSLNTN